MKRILFFMVATLCTQAIVSCADPETKEEEKDRFMMLLTTTEDQNPDFQARATAIKNLLEGYPEFGSLIFEITDRGTGMTLDYTPLIYALSSGKIGLAMVLNPYIDPAQALAGNPEQGTAGYANLLDFVAQFNYTDDAMLDIAYDLLKQHEALIPALSETVNENFNTPLNEIFFSQSDPFIASMLIKMFLSLGATPNPLRETPPIFIAIENENWEALAALMEYGADLNATNSNGEKAADLLTEEILDILERIRQRNEEEHNEHNLSLDNLCLDDSQLPNENDDK